MCAFMFHDLLVFFMLVGSVGVGVSSLPVLGIRMVQSKTSWILPGFCVCVRVFL